MESTLNTLRHRLKPLLLAACTLPALCILGSESLAAEGQVDFNLYPPKMDYAKLCVVDTKVTKPERDFTQWDGVSNPKISTERALDLAELYSEGSYETAQNFDVAHRLLQWVVQKHDKSLGRAYLLLAGLALDGSGIPQDTGLAATYLKQASELGLIGSDAMLARIALAEARFADAAELLRKDMFRGSYSAAITLARLYADKLVPSPKEDSAKQTFLAAQGMLLAGLSKGQCSALYLMGKMYKQGIAIPADEKMAAQWMDAAAQAGDVGAMLELAHASLRGVGIAYDAQKIIDLWTKAANRGSVEAAFELGRSYLRGTTAKADMKLAVQWLERSAKQNYEDAIDLLIDVYAGKYAVPADDVKYVTLLQKAAARPDVKSKTLYKLAQAYEAGTGVTADSAKAFELYLQSARMGHKKANLKVARAYQQGVGVPANPKRSLRFFRLASSLGNHDATIEMQRIYTCGVGVEPNKKKADLWMGRAVAGDSIAGLLERADQLFTQNTKESNAQAIGYLERGVKLGDRKAMVMLGAAYMRGLGNEGDKQQAQELFKQAIAEGKDKQFGLFAYAKQLMLGVSVPKDLSRAKVLLEEAVKLGDNSAQYELAKLLPQVEENQKAAGVRALALLKQAALAGHETAALTLADRLPDNEAQEWLERAANGGSLKATLQLAEHYYEQAGNPEAQTQAAKWMNLAVAYHPCDLDGQLVMAKAYALGWGGKKDAAAAQMWYTRAMASAPVTATQKAELAEVLLKGYGVQPNPEKALAMYKDAANMGDERSMREVGRMYLAGEGVKADKDAAVEWLGKAVTLGDAPAMIDMGVLLQSNTSDSQRDQQALVYFQRAADLGELKAMRLLGKLYSKNKGALYDPQLAAQWFEKAATLGDVSAMFSLVDLYSDNRDLQADASKVKYWVEQALKMNPSRAADLLNIADAYAQGVGVTQNKAEAFRLRTLAAKNNNPQAMREVARSYQHGVGTAQQPEIALEWFKKAADAGDAGSMVEIGKAFKNGFGVKQDAKVAFDYFLKASNLQETDGMIQLAQCYFQGSGVAVNPAKGIEWYEKASSMGDTRAMMQLSNAYASGYGVKISSEKSLYWLKKAADGGSESARRQLDVLQRMKVKQQ